MKAISMWEPWAVLCVIEDELRKKFETRSWYTVYRGPLLIHAAKKCDREILLAINTLAPFLIPLGIHGPSDLSFGALIGRVQLVACHRTCDLPLTSAREHALGDWSPGRYAWEFSKPERFATPIPYRGAQGLFNVSPRAFTV